MEYQRFSMNLPEDIRKAYKDILKEGVMGYQKRQAIKEGQDLREFQYKGRTFAVKLSKNVSGENYWDLYHKN